jgi:hypothetical protein
MIFKGASPISHWWAEKDAALHPVVGYVIVLTWPDSPTGGLADSTTSILSFFGWPGAWHRHEKFNTTGQTDQCSFLPSIVTVADQTKQVWCA